MYERRVSTSGPFGGGDFGPPPKDLVVLLVVLFGTFVLQSFESTRIVPALLELSPLVLRGFVWQVLTYGFVATPSGLWLLLSLLMIYLFGRDILGRLGRRQFWTVLLAGIGAAGVAATLVYLAVASAGLATFTAYPFALLTGPSIQLTVLVTAFSVLYRHATLLFMFVLPVRASWFIAITLLGAFVSFLGSKDLAGFVGLVTAVGTVYVMLTGSGPVRMLRQGWLRLQRRVLEARLRRTQKKRGFRVVQGGRESGRGNGGGGGRPWVH